MHASNGANKRVSFISQVDPDLDGPTLPSAAADEFRPFARRLPEFKFWWAATRAVALGFAATFFPVLDVPVFWPILVAYFCALFFVTMKRQIKHMVKHRYVPFSLGKPKHGKGGGARWRGRSSNVGKGKVAAGPPSSGPSHPPLPPFSVYTHALLLENFPLFS